MSRFKQFVWIWSLLLNVMWWRTTAAQEPPLAEAARLYPLAIKLHQEGKTKEAIGPATRVYQICRTALGEEHADTLTALSNLAIMLQSQGDAATARQYYDYVLRIRLKNFGEMHADTALAYNNLGDLFREQGKQAEARSHLEQAIKIFKNVLGEEHPSTALAIHNLGSVLQSQGDYAAARPQMEQALKIFRKVHGEENPLTLKAHSNLGYLLQQQGELAAARPFVEQALKMRRKILGEEHPDTAESYNNFAFLLQAQGDLAAALPNYENALRIWRIRLGNEHPQTAIALNNIGFLHAQLENYVAARPYYEQALQIRRKVLGEEHYDTGYSTNNLGLLLIEQGEYAAAIPLLEQSSKIWSKVFGTDHPSTATTLNNLGGLYYAQGDYLAARPYFERARSIYRQTLGHDHPDTIRSLMNLARLEAGLEKWPAAGGLFEEARRGARRHLLRVLPGLSEREQLLFLQQNDEWNLHCALTLGLLQRDDAESVSRSAEWLLNGKAVAQTTLAERTLLARDAQEPKSAVLVAQLLDVRRRLAQLSLTTPSSGQESQHREQLDTFGIKESELARAVAQMTARPTVAETWVEIGDVQKSLTTESRLIDIVRMRPYVFTANGKKNQWQPARYVAWIVPPSGAENIRIVDLGEAQAIDKRIEQVRRLIANAGEQEGVLKQQGEEEAVKELQEKLAALAGEIWMPLTPHLGDAQKILLSPDASLWLVPWNALPTGDRDELLIEKYTLGYVISGRDVARTVRKPSPIASPIIFANPDFDLSPNEVRQRANAVLKTQAPKLEDSQSRSLTVSNKSLLPKVPPLPGTASEAKSITPPLKSYTSSEPQLYTEKYALESVAKAIRSPRVIVFSTHGFFLPDQPKKLIDRLSDMGAGSVAPAADKNPFENPLLRCGLLLAGCNAGGSGQGIAGDDGILTGLEIVGLDLRSTELVVLSACETGVGEIQNGEGVAGLRQAFQLAGAESVVATLWQIPDTQSARLMSDFFTNLAAGQSKSEALRNAQLKLIQARRERFGAAHPFFWAAFTLTR